MQGNWKAFTVAALGAASFIAIATIATAQTTAPPAAAAAANSKSGDAKGGDKGELAFNNACRTCHTTKEGDNRLGPNLANIIGRKAGAVDGFAYSQSIKSLGLTWDEASLDKFIADPNAVAPGNNMKPYNGIASAEDRKAIIEHLKSAK